MLQRGRGPVGQGATQGQTLPGSLDCPNDMLLSALNAPSRKPIRGLTSNVTLPLNPTHTSNVYYHCARLIYTQVI